MTDCDIIIIGGGIAGASLAWQLAQTHKKRQGRILLLEAEDVAGRHATGRSAAFFAETYGNETIRALTRASRSFFETPPEGLTDAPLLEPCGALYIGREDQLAALDAHYEATRALAPEVERHGPEFALARVPVLRREQVAGCVYEPGSKAINVHDLLQGYLKGARQGGVEIITNARVCGLERENQKWAVKCDTHTMTADIVVNAAGAWAGQIGKMAGGVDPGLTPLRRSVCVIDPAKANNILDDISTWPLVLDVEEGFYFKPSGGMIWLSPAEEDPSAPCDAAPDELTLARAVDRLERATTLKVQRLEHKWAGLRTFTSDRTPVVGFDPKQDGFFWLAGQGGYGIQTSPALSHLAARLLAGTDEKNAGARMSALTPSRFVAEKKGQALSAPVLA